jgi:hypothetical protein
MPMLFWLPAVIISEMWSMAWAEMPTVTRPIRLPRIDKKLSPTNGVQEFAF